MKFIDVNTGYPGSIHGLSRILGSGLRTLGVLLGALLVLRRVFSTVD